MLLVVSARGAWADEAQSQAQADIDCRQALARTLADNTWLAAETIQMRAETAFLASHRVRSVAPLRLLEGHTAALKLTLEKKTTDLQQRETTDVAAWRQARESRLASAERVVPLELAGMIALAICGCLAVAAYRGRRWVRRRLPGGGITALAAVVAASVLIAAGSAAIWPGWAQLRPSGKEPACQPAETTSALQAQLNAAQAAGRRHELAYERAKAQWKQAASGTKPDIQALTDEWLSLRGVLRAASIAAAGQRSAADGLKARQAELARAQVSAVVTSLPLERQLATAGLGTACCLWGAAAMVEWARRRRVAGVCPKCNTAGQLKSVPLGEQHSFRVLHDLVCEAKWDGRNRCGFRMPREQRHASRLCFPIIGVPASGKTHWLASAYDRLMNETYPAHLDFQHVETRGSAELDRLLARLHSGQRQLEANQVTLPDPVVFRFSDQGKLAQCQALVNLFDYSGEVFRMLDLDCPLRRRMLEADGVLLFLDPIDGPETQLHEFKRFLTDAQRHSLDVPVAVCVTKIDLLLADQRLPEVCDFQRQLAAIEASRWHGCGERAAIEARSRATAELLDRLWPQVNIGRMLEKMFPGRFRYFPLTSVGIGRPTDPPDPQWVLEPLVWLLARSGLDVFHHRPASSRRVTA